MIAQWTLQDYWINLLVCNVDRSKAQEMHSCTDHYISWPETAKALSVPATIPGVTFPTSTEMLYTNTKDKKKLFLL